MANFKAPLQMVQVWTGLLATELQSFFCGTFLRSTFIGHQNTQRVTESQAPNGTQYTGGGNFFVSHFNKLPYSLCSQGDKCFEQHISS